MSLPPSTGPVPLLKLPSQHSIEISAGVIFHDEKNHHRTSAILSFPRAISPISKALSQATSTLTLTGLIHGRHARENLWTNKARNAYRANLMAASGSGILEQTTRPTRTTSGCKRHWPGTRLAEATRGLHIRGADSPDYQTTGDFINPDHVAGGHDISNTRAFEDFNEEYNRVLGRLTTESSRTSICIHSVPFSCKQPSCGQ